MIILLSGEIIFLSLINFLLILPFHTKSFKSTVLYNPLTIFGGWIPNHFAVPRKNDETIKIYSSNGPKRDPLFLNFNNFSDNAVKVLMLSQEEAKRTLQSQIITEHIFQGLVCLDTGLAAHVLKEFGVTITATRDATRISPAGKCDNGKYRNQLLTFSPAAKESLEFSSSEAERLGNPTIETEHILLGVLRDKSVGMVNLLSELSLDASVIRDATLRAISHQKDNSDNKNAHDSAKNGIDTYSYMHTTGPSRGESLPAASLASFTVDLSEKAENGLLSKVVHRAVEIDRAIRTLCRKTKRNPLLIGEPGVGKTAIVEGIAMKIAEGNVLPCMLGKRILQLEIGLLIAGTKFRGQFEERLTKLIEEIKIFGNIILVIDEAHMLVGAGAGDGALDAANLLKPPLSRGEIQCIAITTPKEYKKYFEKDSALSRRFQPIHVDEPSDDDTLKILSELSLSYGHFHNVRYSPDAVKLAIKYSKRYVNDRFLPDKAIDILDESGSLAKIQFQEKIAEKEKEKGNAMILDSPSEVDFKKNNAQPNLSGESVVYGNLNGEDTKNRDGRSTKHDILGVVNKEHVAKVVSAWTGIPLGKLTDCEMNTIRNMESELHKTVVGQDEAVKNICKAIRRAKTNIKNPERPIGSFLFCGPPGVGKSEVARSLTKHFFAKNSLIRLDMSEYSEPHSISRILGSPPGYKGHDSGGQLTEKVKRMPYSVVMFDEIEKAHHDVLNVLLQILEDGKLTDAKNQVVSFKSTIIIMTSNMGSNVIQKMSKGIHSFGFNVEDTDPSNYSRIKSLVMEELKSQFKPELINRIDDIILFKPLSEDEIFDVATIMLKEVVNRAKNAGVSIKIDEKFVHHILKLPRDEQCGARPLRRLITSVLEDKLAELIISPDFNPKLTYLVTVDSESAVHLKPADNEDINEAISSHLKAHESVN